MAHPLYADSVSPLPSFPTQRSTSSMPPHTINHIHSGYQETRKASPSPVPDTPTQHTMPEYPNTPIPDKTDKTATQMTAEQAFQQPLTLLEDSSLRIQSFFLVALIALVGWVIVQTLFSLSPFGRAEPFVVLGIEFVWWLSLLAILAYLFKRVLNRLNFSTLNLKLVKRQLDIAHEEIVQKNALLEQSIKDVWAARRRFSLPANVVAPGHYQIQDLFGGYRDVRVQNELGGHKLVCDCYVYKKDGICTHTIAAASLHLRVYSILRQRRRATTRTQAKEHSNQGDNGMYRMQDERKVS